MRACRTCGLEKGEDGFYVDSTGRPKLDCKPCYCEVTSANGRARYARHRAQLNAIKLESGCVDCGYRDHPAALDFDHLPGTDKRLNISKETKASWARIEAELAKCEVVCANCHRVRTETRRADTHEYGLPE